MKFFAIRTRMTGILILGVALALLVNGPIFAQGFDVPVTKHHAATTDSSSVEVQYGHLFETNTDNGGNVSRNTASLALKHRIGMSDNLGLTLQGGYQLSAYDFSGSPNPGNGASQGAGNFQWDDIHEFRAVGLFDYKLNEKWSILTALALFSHIEGGADFSDGITGGAAVGFNYSVSEDLQLGLLLGASTSLEDSATLFPIPRVDWRFADGWRWRIDTMSAFGGRGIGTELSVKASESVEIAIGITRQRKRFRLANHGGSAVDRGVGEESSVPAFVRLGYAPAPNIHLDVRAGIALQGEVRTESKTGNRVETDNFDAAPIVGVGGYITF